MKGGAWIGIYILSCLSPGPGSESRSYLPESQKIGARSDLEVHMWTQNNQAMLSNTTLHKHLVSIPSVFRGAIGGGIVGTWCVAGL